MNGIAYAVTPAPRDAWRSVVASSPEAMGFHEPQWLDAVVAAGPWRNISRMYLLSDGRRLVLPLVARHHAGVWVHASLPYGWGFGGVVAEGPVSAADVVLVVTDVASLGVARTILRPNPLVRHPWPADLPFRAVRVGRLAHVLDLRGGFEEVWKSRFTGSARTAVRKAEREQVTVESDSGGRLLPAFYELYERSMLRWNPGSVSRWRARRREPLGKFRAVVEQAGQTARVWVAWHRGRPAAAILTVRGGHSVNYWRGAMDEALAGPTRANYLLHRLAIEDACRAGCTSYHMGETGESSSLAQFKTRFGAQPVPYTELRIERLPFTGTEAWIRSAVGRGIRIGRLTSRTGNSTTGDKP